MLESIFLKRVACFYTRGGFWLVIEFIRTNASFQVGVDSWSHFNSSWRHFNFAKEDVDDCDSNSDVSKSSDVDSISLSMKSTFAL